MERLNLEMFLLMSFENSVLLIFLVSFENELYNSESVVNELCDD